jgi:hypothetical protein
MALACLSREDFEWMKVGEMLELLRLTAGI